MSINTNDVLQDHIKNYIEKLVNCQDHVVARYLLETGYKPSEICIVEKSADNGDRIFYPDLKSKYEYKDETGVEKIISNEEIERVHGNANFGSMTKREVVKFGILKCASGYYQGYTSRTICKEHGLIDEDYKLTTKGRNYLWACFNEGTRL